MTTSVGLMLACSPARLLACSPARLLACSLTALAPTSAAPPTDIATWPLYEPFEFVIPTGYLSPVTGVAFTESDPTGSNPARPGNPWLDYRLDVELKDPSGNIEITPGFYAGDGAFGSSGSVWAARFAGFGQTGVWQFRAALYEGIDCNVLDIGTTPATVVYQGLPSRSVRGRATPRARITG